MTCPRSSLIIRRLLDNLVSTQKPSYRNQCKTHPKNGEISMPVMDAAERVLTEQILSNR